MKSLLVDRPGRRNGLHFISDINLNWATLKCGLSEPFMYVCPVLNYK